MGKKKEINPKENLSRIRSLEVRLGHVNHIMD